VLLLGFLLVELVHLVDLVVVENEVVAVAKCLKNAVAR
jgi:hypothetical protein